MLDALASGTTDPNLLADLGRGVLRPPRPPHASRQLARARR
jgi:hypothetical protein